MMPSNMSAIARLIKKEDMSRGAAQILPKVPARFITKQALNIINRMKRSR